MTKFGDKTVLHVHVQVHFLNLSNIWRETYKPLVDVRCYIILDTTVSVCNGSAAPQKCFRCVHAYADCMFSQQIMLKVNTNCFPTEYSKFFEMRQICSISIIHNFPKRSFKHTVARTFLCENIPRPMVSLVV